MAVEARSAAADGAIAGMDHPDFVTEITLSASGRTDIDGCAASTNVWHATCRYSGKAGGPGPGGAAAKIDPGTFYISIP